MVPRSRYGGATTITSAHILLVVVVLYLSVASATVPDIPSRPDSWTSRNHLGGASARSSSSSVGIGSSALFNDDSTARLEEEASREVRETFGEDFSKQLEEECDAVRSVHEQKARIGKEAGCSPISPLSSSSMPSLSSLGSLGLPDHDGADEGREVEVERRSQRGLEGPLTDWLR